MHRNHTVIYRLLTIQKAFDFSIRRLCFFIGFSRQTVYYWMDGLLAPLAESEDRVREIYRLARMYEALRIKNWRFICRSVLYRKVFDGKSFFEKVCLKEEIKKKTFFFLKKCMKTKRKRVQNGIFSILKKLVYNRTVS